MEVILSTVQHLSKTLMVFGKAINRNFHETDDKARLIKEVM